MLQKNRNLPTLLLAITVSATLLLGCNQSSDSVDQASETSTVDQETITTDSTTDESEKTITLSADADGSAENEPAVALNNQPKTSTPSDATGSPSSEAKPANNPAERPAEPKAENQDPKISAEAFRLAAYEGDLARVRSAVEGGMDVNGFDPTQKLTALHMAAYNGHTAIVQYLLQQGAEVDSRDGEKKTPLIHACTGPFAATVKALIQAGADLNAKDGTESFTPLMMAAGLGEAEVVDILLANNASVDQKDEDQDTAIDHARNAGHEAIVKKLENALSAK